MVDSLRLLQDPYGDDLVEDTSADTPIEYGEELGADAPPAPARSSVSLFSTPPVQEETSWLDTAGNAVKGFLGGVASTAASIPQGAVIQSYGARRDAAKRGDVMGAAGLPTPPYGGDVASYMFEREAEKHGETEQILENARNLSAKDVLNNPLYRAAENFKSSVRTAYPVDPEFEKSFMGQLSAGLGSAVGFTLTSLVGGPISVAFSGASAGAQSGFVDALRKGASADEAFNTAKLTAVLGTSNALPIMYMFKRLDKGTGGLFTKTLNEKLNTAAGKVIAGGVAGAIEEALQETMELVGNNFIASDLVGYDEERALLEGAGMSAGVGAGTGFIINTLLGAAGIKRASKAGELDGTAQELLDELVYADMESPDVAARRALDPNSVQEPEVVDPGYVVPTETMEELKSRAVDVTTNIPRPDIDAPAANADDYFENNRLEEAGELAFQALQRVDFGDNATRNQLLDRIKALLPAARAEAEGVVAGDENVVSSDLFGLPQEQDLEAEVPDLNQMASPVDFGNGIDVWQDPNNLVGPEQAGRMFQAAESLSTGGAANDSLVPAASAPTESVANVPEPVENADPNGVYQAAIDVVEGRLTPEEAAKRYPERAGDFFPGGVDPSTVRAIDDANTEAIEAGVRSAFPTMVEPLAQGQSVRIPIAGQDSSRYILARRTKGGVSWREAGVATPRKGSIKIERPAEPEQPPVDYDSMPDQPTALSSSKPQAWQDVTLMARHQAPTSGVGGAAQVAAGSRGDITERNRLPNQPRIKFTSRNVAVANDGSKLAVPSTDAISIQTRAQFSLNPQSWFVQPLKKAVDKLFATIDKTTNSRFNKTKRLAWRAFVANIQQAHGQLILARDRNEYMERQWSDTHKGQSLQDAPRETLRTLNAYSRRQISREEAQKLVPMPDGFYNALDDTMAAIAKYSDTLIAEGAVEAPLQTLFKQNQGSYLHVSYLLKDFASRNKTARELIEAVPAGLRNTLAMAAQKAYNDPIVNGTLKDMKRGQLMRLAHVYGIVVEEDVFTTDPKTGKERGSVRQTITGTGIDLESATKSELVAAILDATQSAQILPDSIALSFLQGSTEGSRQSGGRQKSLERKRTLSRTEEELRKEGYSEEEIEVNKAVREVLMEALDPVTSSMSTIKGMLNSIVAFRVANDIASLHRIGLASFTQADIEGPSEKIVGEDSQWADVIIRVPNKPSEFKKLKDLYVSPEIKDQFERQFTPNYIGSSGNNSAVTFLANAYRKLNVAVKVGLTSLNLPAHPRNKISSSMISLMRGYVINPNFLRSWKQAGRIVGYDQDFTRRGKEYDSDEARTLAYLTELGVMHDSARLGATQDLAGRGQTTSEAAFAIGGGTSMGYADPTGSAFNLRLVEDSGKGWASKLYNSVRSRIPEKVRKRAANITYKGPLSAYRLEDEADKVAAWFQEREMTAKGWGRDDLVQIMRGEFKGKVSDAQIADILEIDKEVAEVVKNQFPTYSRVGELGKDLSANMFAVPFPSFNLEMIRNQWHDWRDQYDMLRGQGRYAKWKPAEVRKKLALKIAGTATAFAIMDGLVTSIFSAWDMVGFGEVPDEDDEIFAAAQAQVDKLYSEDRVKETPEGKIVYDALDPFVRPLLPSYLQNRLTQVVEYDVEDMTVTVRDMDFTIPMAQSGKLAWNVSAAVGSYLDGDKDQANITMQLAVQAFLADYVAWEPNAEAWLSELMAEDRTNDLPSVELADTAANILETLGRMAPYVGLVSSIERTTRPEDDPKSMPVSDLLVGVRTKKYEIPVLYTTQLRGSLISLGSKGSTALWLIRRSDEMSDEEFAAEYRAIEESRQYDVRRASDLVRATSALGIRPSKLLQWERKAGLNSVGQMSMPDIRKGKWEPLKFTTQDLDDPKFNIKDPKVKDLARRRIEQMKAIQQEEGWR